MQNVTPRVGGGDRNKSPKTGGGDHNKTPTNPRGGKSAPTEAPAVRSGVSIPRNGDPYTPTSVKNTQVAEPPQPPGPDRSRR